MTVLSAEAPTVEDKLDSLSTTSQANTADYSSKGGSQEVSDGESVGDDEKNAKLNPTAKEFLPVSPVRPQHHPMMPHHPAHHGYGMHNPGHVMFYGVPPQGYNNGYGYQHGGYPSKHPHENGSSSPQNEGEGSPLPDNGMHVMAHQNGGFMYGPPMPWMMPYPPHMHPMMQHMQQQHPHHHNPHHMPHHHNPHFMGVGMMNPVNNNVHHHNNNNNVIINGGGNVDVSGETNNNNNDLSFGDVSGDSSSNNSVSEALAGATHPLQADASGENPQEQQQQNGTVSSSTSSSPSPQHLAQHLQQLHIQQQQQQQAQMYQHQRDRNNQNDAMRGRGQQSPTKPGQQQPQQPQSQISYGPRINMNIVHNTRSHQQNGGQRSPPSSSTSPSAAAAMAAMAAMSAACSSNDEAHYRMDVERVRLCEDPRTTVMVKNIPNKYTQKNLLELIDRHHEGTYDFFYLPIDFKNKCNLGYAFINFSQPKHLIPFFLEFANKRWGRFNSDKVCELTYARIQSKQSLVSHFRNSRLMFKHEKYRPIVFGEGNNGNGSSKQAAAAFPAAPASYSPQQGQHMPYHHPSHQQHFNSNNSNNHTNNHHIHNSSKPRSVPIITSSGVSTLESEEYVATA